MPNSAKSVAVCAWASLQAPMGSLQCSVGLWLDSSVKEMSDEALSLRKVF